MDETKEILLAIKHSVEMMDAKITRMERDVAELKTDVAELKTDVAELKSGVAELKTTTASLKSDSDELKNGQLRQMRLLETLCLRSLEQENIVRDLQLNKP
ncbi:hypothetical protein J4772_33105 [Cohnella sp. LGH]|uniref:hypothetical protein n=1 Tax=Cohnella sp. LGH TaxID=1619153 RepID=UPI001ADBC691|nr:hypothetical protein [Cohnella sp. LGH]QTH42263.1 hypothetical protein J4772_33105 [Cohnella sp. LGH]